MLVNQAQNTQNQVPKEPWLYPIWEFTVHICIGTFFFLIIAISAVGLNLLVNWLISLNVSIFIIRGLQVAEYFLFGIDIVLYIIFLAGTSWNTMHKLFKRKL